MLCVGGLKFFFFRLLLCVAFFSKTALSEGAQVPDSFWTDNIPEETRFEEGEGTPSNPWQIATPAQLALLSLKVSEGDPRYMTGHYRLTRDIDLSAHYWVPIGRDYARHMQLISNTALPFRGTFEGGNRTIFGLTCKESTLTHIGLFGVTERATIRNVVLKNACIDDADEVRTAGIIVGKMVSGLLENCTTDGTIRIATKIGIPGDKEEIHSLGGIFGRNFGGTVIGCVNNAQADFSGVQTRFLNTGGIGGANSGGLIRGCINNGSLTSGLGDINHAGGIVGFNDKGTVLDSISRGTINENVPPFRSIHASVGGVAGENDGFISGSANEADIYGEWAEEASNTGGIAGWNFGRIEKSINRGRIETWNADSTPPGNARTGGIAGWNSGQAAIADCINDGGIIGEAGRYSHAGSNIVSIGRVRRVTGTGGIVRDISMALASPDAVRGFSHVGGIVGANSGSTILRCYAWTSPALDASVGIGLLAGENRGKIDGCYALQDQGSSTPGIGIGLQEGSFSLDKNAFASSDSFETSENARWAIDAANSAWFYPDFDAARPRLKHFYFPDNGDTPRISVHPANMTFDYGVPSQQEVFLAFADGRIAIEKISFSPNTGLSESSFEPTKIVLRYDGKGKVSAPAVVAYNFYYDDANFRTFSLKLPIVVQNAPEEPVFSTFVLLVAVAVLFIVILLIGATVWTRYVSRQEKKDDDVYL